MISPALLERLQELQDKVSDERANLSALRGLAVVAVFAVLTSLAITFLS